MTVIVLAPLNRAAQTQWILSHFITLNEGYSFRHQTSCDSLVSDHHVGSVKFVQCPVYVGVSVNGPPSLWQPAHEVELYIYYTRISMILNMSFSLLRQMGRCN